MQTNDPLPWCPGKGNLFLCLRKQHTHDCNVWGLSLALAQHDPRMKGVIVDIAHMLDYMA